MLNIVCSTWGIERPKMAGKQLQRKMPRWKFYCNFGRIWHPIDSIWIKIRGEPQNQQVNVWNLKRKKSTVHTFYQYEWEFISTNLPTEDWFNCTGHRTSVCNAVWMLELCIWINHYIQCFIQTSIFSGKLQKKKIELVKVVIKILSVE